jgi:NAD(P)-dependent dehydrogenase (short-subunit alcohol dehydrogenase family)
VNALSAGSIATPLYSKLGLSGEQLKSTAASLRQQIPARRFDTAAGMAAAVVYFGSDESAFTVGAELMIDGGMSEI